MKKTIFALIFALSSFSAFAKNIDPISLPKLACLIPVEEVTVFRYVNVSFIRQIEILPNEPNIIRMFIAHSNGGKLLISYNSPKDAKAALLDFVQKIHSCK